MSTPSTALSSNGYVIQNPGGPKMTPLIPAPSPSQPASPAAADPTQSSSLASGVKGLFGKIGAGLKAALPYLPSIANHLAAAAGNYGPLEEQHQEEELALRQQNAGLQRDLAQSTLRTQELNRKQTQLGIDSRDSIAAKLIMEPVCNGPHAACSVTPAVRVEYVTGGVGERLKPAVLKTVRLERVSGVRIPPPPPHKAVANQLYSSYNPTSEFIQCRK
jgi:hypothetical protein